MHNNGKPWFEACCHHTDSVNIFIVFVYNYNNKWIGELISGSHRRLL